MEKNDPFLEKSLGERLSEIETRIRKARSDAPLASAQTILMGASKMQKAETILEAIDAGLKSFGENRVQEAEEKWPAIRTKHPSVKLHLIGALQTNKVKDAVQLFDVIESVDREKLVDAIAKENNRRANQFFIQVNIGEEEQKGGALPKDTNALIAYARAAGLNVVGLMCIPPADEYPAPYFALLRKIAMEENLNELSMGMSSDYELAARMGATIVRVGSLLFGSRQ